MSLRGPRTLFRIREGGQARALCIEGWGSVLTWGPGYEFEGPKYIVSDPRGGSR